MNGRSRKSRNRAVLLTVLTLAAAIGIATALAAVWDRGDAEPPPLHVVEGECDGLDVTPYNSLMSDRFSAAPFMTFSDADRSTYGSDYATCETTPDLDDLCGSDESAECGDLLSVAAEHDLWVSIDYDCQGFCGLTEEEAAEIREKEEVEGWDWAVPASATRKLSGEDRANGGTHQGQLISVYRFENLQITIDLELGYAAEGAVTEADLARYDDDLWRFAEVNQAFAEAIRDSAVERRDDAA